MTATVTTTVPSNPTTAPASTHTPVWRAGLAAGVVAAAATTAIAAVGVAAGVSFESAPGDAIPVVGFAQMTLLFTAIGVLIARTIGRKASYPRATFTKTAIALTALSVVPDLSMSFDAASKLTLMLTHVVAAAIVIPVLASRLDAEGRR